MSKSPRPKQAGHLGVAVLFQRSDQCIFRRKGLGKPPIIRFWRAARLPNHLGRTKQPGRGRKSPFFYPATCRMAFMAA